MIKKLKSRAGLTLTEMLVTLLILTIFSSACLVGITTAFRARQDKIKAHDADILASMVTQLITDELRFCEFTDTDPIASDGKSITYRSHTSGYNKVTLGLNDEDGLGGRLCMMINATDGGIPQMMLNDAAYSTFPLCLDELTFSQDGNGNICVNFDVCDNDGRKIAHEEFYVKPLNAGTASPEPDIP